MVAIILGILKCMFYITWSEKLDWTSAEFWHPSPAAYVPACACFPSRFVTEPTSNFCAMDGCRSAIQHGVSAGIPDPRSTLLPWIYEDSSRSVPDHAGRHQVVGRQHSPMVLVSVVSISGVDSLSWPGDWDWSIIRLNVIHPWDMGHSTSSSFSLSLFLLLLLTSPCIFVVYFILVIDKQQRTIRPFTGCIQWYIAIYTEVQTIRLSEYPKNER